MTDPGGLGEAILLRLADRILSLEQQSANNTAAIKSLADHVTEIRGSVSALSRDVEAVRGASTAVLQTVEQMRTPLQGLLELRQRFSGAWLVATALLIVVGYLFQPLLAELYHWRLGGG